jgi:DNA-binding MarR family transcriptional regulator
VSKRVNPSPADVPSLGDLPGALGYALRRAQLLVFADFSNTLHPIDLRPAQYGVLVVVGANPGVNQSAVCLLLGFKQANLVALINLLVKRGLAERRKSAQDARSSALFLTAAGQQLLKRAHQLQQQHERRMVKRLGDAGRTQLLELLATLG